MLFIQHPVDLSDSSGRNKVWTSSARPQQHVHDDWRCRHTLSSTALQDRHFLRRSLSAEKHTCLVLALQARQSPNTQDQAGRLKAATGRLVLRRNSPCEVAESFIRRPQNNFSCTGCEPEYRDAVCVGFLRNSTVNLWRFTSERSIERGSLFPFFVLATEAREDPTTSRHSRESHGETRSTGHVLNDVVGKVPVRSCRECHRKT